MSFSKELKQIRLECGFKSVRKFYSTLEEKADVSFNYSYYTRVENGVVFPSSKFLKELSPALTRKQSEHLVLAYCQEQFPAFINLFTPASYPSTKSIEKNSPIEWLKKTKELSLRQVQCLAKSEAHYSVFLTCALSRKIFPFEELSQILPYKNLKLVLQDLKKEKIIFHDQNEIRAISNEIRFPPESSFSELKDIYKLFSDWEKELPKKLGFQKIGSKFIIRRTTKKTAILIQKHHELLIELLRNSEESRTEILDEVLVFDYSLYSGKLPG